MSSLDIEPTKNKQKVLVISGGGARGAWGGGLIKALYEKQNPDYRCIVGNSTGSLLAPLIAINDFTKIEEAFTDLTMKDIFNVNPFREDGEINLFQAILRILCGKENLGETKNLRDRITRFFTPEVYDKIKALERVVKASVVNLSSNEVQYLSTACNSYSDMVDWLWASANQPVFMTAVNKNNQKWVDGGLKENVPIAEGLKYAAVHDIQDIDVVVNNQKGENKDSWPQCNRKTNIIPKLLRIINIFSDEVRQSDIEIGVCKARVQDMKIYLHYMTDEEYNLCPKSLLFKKDVLIELWKRGYEHTFPKRFVPIILPGNNKIFLR